MHKWLDNATQWWGGDFNSHIGKDHANNKHGLDTPTPASSRDFLDMLLTRTSLTVADWNLHCWKRGTWCHNITAKWYELDTFLTPNKDTRAARSLKVTPVSYSDHKVKTMVLHITTSTKVDKWWLRSSTTTTNKQPLLLDKMKGPSKGATEKRLLYANKMNEFLMEEVQKQELRTTTFKTEGSLGTLHIYVDGSGKGFGGWGTCIKTRESELNFHGPIVTSATKGDTSDLFLGAEVTTNNCGELTGMAMALAWCRSAGLATLSQYDTVTIHYDSTYAANAIPEITRSKANKSLILKARRLYAEVTQKVRVRLEHVYSHTGLEDEHSLGNEIADGLASKGSTGDERLWPGALTITKDKIKAEHFLSIPDIPYEKLTKKIVEVAEEVVGRGKKNDMAVPYSRTDLEHIAELNKGILAQTIKVGDATGTDAILAAKKELSILRNALQRYKLHARRNWGEDLSKRIDTALQRGDFTEFYKLLKHAGLFSSDRAIMTRLPFSTNEATAYNRKIGDETFTIPQQARDNLPTQVPICEALAATPDIATVTDCIDRMKDTVSGKDEVTVGLLRQAGAALKRAIAKMIIKCWDLAPNQWPTAMSEVIGILLYKKNDRSDLANYRTIMLIQVISRVIAKIVAVRITDYAEKMELLPETQYGSRSSRDTLGLIFILRVLGEMFSMRKTAGLADVIGLLAVDIRKAYPRVPRELAWMVFSRFGIPDKLITILKGLHELPSYQVRIQNSLGDPYKMLRGFREGCPSSPILFNLYHTQAINHFKERSKTVLQPMVRLHSHEGRSLKNAAQHRHSCVRPTDPSQGSNDHTVVATDILELLFADDSSAVMHINDFVLGEDLLNETFAWWGEDIHADKTERLAFGVSAAEMSTISDRSWTNTLKFLGAWFSHDMDMDCDSDKRMTKSRILWSRLYKQVNRLGLPLKTLGCLYTSVVLGSLLYGCECRAFTKKQIATYQTWCNKHVFGLLGQKRLDMHTEQKTMSDLRKKLGILPISTTIGIRRLRLLHRMASLPQDRLERKALFWWIDSEHDMPLKRRVGSITVRGQMWELLDEMRGFTGLTPIAWQHGWLDIAQNKLKWRKLSGSWLRMKAKVEQADEWSNRHAVGGSAERRVTKDQARKLFQAGISLNVNGLVNCTHCNGEFRPNAVFQHVVTCAQLTTAERVTAKRNRDRRTRKMVIPLGASASSSAASAAPVVPSVVPAPPSLPSAPKLFRLSTKTTVPLAPGIPAAHVQPAVIPLVLPAGIVPNPGLGLGPAAPHAPVMRLTGKQRDPASMAHIAPPVAAAPPPVLVVAAAVPKPKAVPKSRLKNRPGETRGKSDGSRDATIARNLERTNAVLAERQQFPERFFPSGQRRKNIVTTVHRGKKLAAVSAVKTGRRYTHMNQLPVWWVPKSRKDGDFTCEWCNKTSIGRHQYIRHTKCCNMMDYVVWLQGIRLVHNSTTEHKCTQCGTSFLTALGASRHAFECKKRRQRSQLPVDSKQYHIVPPPARMPQ